MDICGVRPVQISVSVSSRRLTSPEECLCLKPCLPGLTLLTSHFPLTVISRNDESGQSRTPFVSPELWESRGILLWSLHV